MVTDLTTEHPDKILWRFLLPMMVSVIFQQLYNLADSMIAGKFAGEAALAAVGASPYIRPNFCERPTTATMFLTAAFSANVLHVLSFQIGRAHV